MSGVNRTVVFQSVSISKKLNGRASGFCVIGSPESPGWVPETGEPITIYRDATKVFGGVIEAITGSFIDYPGQTTPHFQCKLSDYGCRLDELRLAGRFYEAGWGLNTVVFDIWSDFLNAEGIPWNTSFVDYSAILTANIESNTYETISQLFTRLANLTGRQWYMDADKYIHFDRYDSSTADSAPINVGHDLDTARNITVSYSKTQYRNRQWVRCGIDIVNSFTDTFTATAGQDLFVTTYRMDAVVSITIDGDAASFSTNTGVEDFQYARGSDGLYRDQHAEFSGGESIVVVYHTPAANVISYQSDAEIAARAAIEGGTGVHEAIDEMQAIATQAEANDYAEGMVRRFGSSGIPVEVRFETDTDGIEPGQKIGVDIPNLGLTNETLIVSEVQARCLLDDLWRYQITCVRGEALQSWDQYLNRVVEIARQGQDAGKVTSSASGAGGGSEVWASWVIANGGDASVGTDVANPVVIDIADGEIATPVEALILCKYGDAPVGANLIVDINYCQPTSPLSSASIFAGTKLVKTAGNTSVETQAAFLSPTPAFLKHGWLTVDVDQVGSTTPGKNITVALRMMVS